MRIDLSAAPDRTQDLLDFLRQMGYKADEVASGLVDVDPESLRLSAFGVPALSLVLHVRVWSTVTETEARIIDLSSGRSSGKR